MGYFDNIRNFITKAAEIAKENSLPFTPESLTNYYNTNKHKTYSLKNRTGKNSTDCSLFVTDYFLGEGFKYPEKIKLVYQ